MKKRILMGKEGWLIGSIVVLLTLLSPMVSAQTCAYPACDVECLEYPGIYGVTEGYVTFDVYWRGLVDPILAYRETPVELQAARGEPRTTTNPEPDSALSFHPTGDRFESALCYREGSYYIQSNVTDQDFNTLLSCSSSSDQVVSYDDEDYCLIVGCGGKYTDNPVYESGPARPGVSRCCGDELDDDPDSYPDWCTSGPNQDDGCRIIGEDMSHQHAGLRSWDDAGFCCGDDNTDDIDTSDCMRLVGGKVCLNLGGEIEPDRYQTIHLDSEWTLVSSLARADSFGFPDSIDWCKEGDLLDEILYDTYDGKMFIRKRCEFTEGASDTGLYGGIAVSPATQGVDLTGIGKAGPYYTTQSTWEWVSPVQQTRGNIYYVPCAGYSVMVINSGANYEVVSCTNDPLYPGTERVFALPGLTNTVQNPFTFQLGPGRPNILCYNDASLPGIYEIGECCAGGSCSTCVASPEDPLADCSAHDGAASRWHFSGGDRIIEHYDHSPERSVIYKRELGDCACFGYALDPLTETCYKTDDPPVTRSGTQGTCNADTAQFHCVCRESDGCETELTHYYCVKDDEGEYGWRTPDFIETITKTEDFNIPLDRIKFGNCPYTPLLQDLVLESGGTHHYCSAQGEWIEDLNVNQETCDAHDQSDWTGSRCCGELGDYPEFYADSEGACWRSRYQPIDGPVIDEVHQAGDHAYTELIVAENAILGCAIDARNPSVSLKPDDQARGVVFNYSVRIQQHKKIDFGGSRGPNIMDRRQFYTLGNFNWASRDTNDWMLSILDIDGVPLVVDNPFCSVVETGEGPMHCGYDERWSEGDMPHLSFIEWPLYEDGSLAGCCEENQCWTGNDCIGGDEEATADLYPPTPGTSARYVCEEGEWKPAIPKYTWDLSLVDYTADQSLCLVDPFGNPANNLMPERFVRATWKQESGNENPVWIGDGQYIFDHLCENGTWVSRTRVIANTLLEYVEERGIGDYTLFCDNWELALNNVNYNLTFITHSAGAPCRNLIQENNDVSLIYLADKSIIPWPASQGDLCNTACKDLSGGDIPCVNAFCVLSYEGSEYQTVVFGVSLNQKFDNQDYPFKDVLTDVGPCTAPDDGNFHACAGGRAWYNPRVESVIYSKDVLSLDGVGFFRSIGEFFSGLVDKVFSYFKKNPVQDQAGYDFSYVKLTRNYDRLYISEIAGKRVEAIEELNIYPVGGGLPRHYLYATFTGFSQDVCTSLDPFISRDNYYSECKRNGNQYIISGFAGSKFIIDEDKWIALTAQLRLDGTEGTGWISACSEGSQLSSNTQECMCGGEVFPGGSEPGAFGTPSSGYCCSNGPCLEGCGADGRCPNSCSNPLMQSCSCDNEVCTGSNKVVFPIRNGAGFFEFMPKQCVGEFVINAVGASYETECETGWVTLNLCDNPDGGMFPGCGQYHFKPTMGELECHQEFCIGYNSNITLRTDWSGAVETSALCCDGAWTTDYRGPATLMYCCDENVYWDGLAFLRCNEENFYVCDGTGMTCGDWVIDKGEQCDDLDDPGCSETCQLMPCGPNTLHVGLVARPCVCMPGYGNCDGDIYTTGCEAVLGSDEHCTRCNEVCEIGSVCISHFHGCDFPLCTFSFEGEIAITDFGRINPSENPICRFPCD